MEIRFRDPKSLTSSLLQGETLGFRTPCSPPQLFPADGIESEAQRVEVAVSSRCFAQNDRMVATLKIT